MAHQHTRRLELIEVIEMNLLSGERGKVSIATHDLVEEESEDSVREEGGKNGEGRGRDRGRGS